MAYTMLGIIIVLLFLCLTQLRTINKNEIVIAKEIISLLKAISKAEGRTP